MNQKKLDNLPETEGEKSKASHPETEISRSNIPEIKLEFK